jgi:hypothetical protein
VLESEDKLDWNTSPEMQFIKDLSLPADTLKFE